MTCLVPFAVSAGMWSVRTLTCHGDAKRAAAGDCLDARRKERSCATR
jgi:hypothetical protein